MRVVTRTGPRPSTASRSGPGNGNVDAFRAMSRQQKLLRGGVVAAAVAAVGVTDAAGELSGPGVVFVLIGAIATALRPDSHAGTVAVVAVAVQWFAGVDDVRSPWTMAAAALVLVIHTAAALAASTPPTATAPLDLVERWSRRAAVVLAATIVVWGLTWAFEALDTGPSALLVAAGALATVGVVRLLWPREA